MKNYLVSFITTHHDTVARRLGEFFGKKGQESDLVFYSAVHDDGVFTCVTPAGYPDKLKSLLQALAITDYHVLLLTPDDKLDALVGEMIVALGIYPRAIPLVVIGGVTKMNSYLVDGMKQKLAKILKNTPVGAKMDDIIVIEDLERDAQALKEKIIAKGSTLEASKGDTERDDGTDGETKVLVDSVFPVKGIGTVILGVVRRGGFKAGSMLELTDPSGNYKNVIVKSIQLHDVDHKECKEGDRVGLAVKGIKPDEVSRENVLATKGLLRNHAKVSINFTLSKFARKPVDISDKQVYHVAVGHQVFPGTPVEIRGGKTAGKLEPGETGTITFQMEKPLALEAGGNHGIVAILEKFAGQLRILGSGNVTPP